MKILYVITSMGHGCGGHFYSCSTIALSYHKLNLVNDKVNICNIGTRQSPIIESLPLKKFFIDVPKNGFIKSVKNFMSIVKKGNYDILHAYDPVSLTFVQICSFFLKKSTIMTKCGGPNLTNWPYIDNMIVFSNENYEFYKKLNKYKNINLFFLSNRVMQNSYDKINIPEEKAKLGLNGSLVLLRIARIGVDYLNSFIHIINIIKQINKKLPNLRLLIIGAIESREAYSKLMKSIDETNEFCQKKAVIIKTTDDYTINASRYIDLADFVVATGRGAMEAMAMLKPVFVSLENKKILLITEETVSKIAYGNFSGRIPKAVDPHLEKFSIENIMTTLIDKEDYLKKVKDFSFNYYERNFSLNTKAIKAYEKIYQTVKNSISSKMKLLDLLIWVVFTCKTLNKWKKNRF